MKKLFLFTMVFFMSSNLVNSQKTISYDENGEKTKTLSEFVKLDLITKKDSSSFAGVNGAELILGPIYSILSSTIKKNIEKRQKSYVANYSNSRLFSKKQLKSNDILTVDRYIINSLNDIKDEENKTTSYLFSLNQENIGLKITLDNVMLLKSKARYKKNENLLISIKIKATIQKKKTPEKKEDPVEYTTVSSEGIITIPIIKVAKKNQIFIDNTEEINSIILNDINLDEIENIVFSVDVTETNINHIEPSVIQTILSENGQDIQSILKKIFGVAEK